MRRWLKGLLFLCMLAGAVLVILQCFTPMLLPWNSIVVPDEFAAARILRDHLEEGTAEVTFQHKNLDQEQLFRVLESTWPYAFSLHSVTRNNGTATVEIRMQNMAAQQQAQLLAQGIVQNSFAEGILLKDKLRVLHDYVVAHCMYDTEAAQPGALTISTGGDAPFTASGALVDGKAVCAGYARAFMMLCEAAHIDSVYIIDESMNHGWNAVRVYDTLYYIDTTYDDPLPDRGQLVSTQYFLLTQEQFELTHTWDTSFYDRVLSFALPPVLGDAQRLYDLGLLGNTIPPTTAMLEQPLSNAVRAALAQSVGLSFGKEVTLAEASAKTWEVLCQNPVQVEQLIQQGFFDAVRARETGLPVA